MNDKTKNNYVNIVIYISTKCNLFCKHCVGNHGLNGENASIEDLRKIASHFPVESKYDITITGGEPFCNKDVLYEFLEHIQDLNPPNLGRCCVSTNGMWIRDEESVKTTFRELKEKGVDCINFISNSKYHAEAGFDRKKLLIAKEVAEKYFDDKEFVFTENEIEKVFPLGRAKTSVPSEEWDWESVCHAKSKNFNKNNAEIYVEPDGTTHVCQCSIFAVTSNILDHTYEEVVEYFRRSTIFNALSSKGPQGIAECLRIIPAYAYWKISELGECAYCDQLHREYPYTISKIG